MSALALLVLGYRICHVFSEKEKQYPDIEIDVKDTFRKF